MAKFIHVGTPERVMNEHESQLPVLQAILDELQQLHMALAVQQSAYLLLSRRLAARGHIQLAGLAADLRLMAQVQDEPGWAESHGSLAAAVMSSDIRSSPQRKSRWRRIS